MHAYAVGHLHFVSRKEHLIFNQWRNAQSTPDARFSEGYIRNAFYRNNPYDILQK